MGTTKKTRQPTIDSQQVVMLQGLADAGTNLAQNVSLAVTAAAFGVEQDAINNAVLMALLGYKAHVAELMLVYKSYVAEVERQVAA